MEMMRVLHSEFDKTSLLDGIYWGEHYDKTKHQMGQAEKRGPAIATYKTHIFSKSSNSRILKFQLMIPTTIPKIKKPAMEDFFFNDLVW